MGKTLSQPRRRAIPLPLPKPAFRGRHMAPAELDAVVRAWRQPGVVTLERPTAEESAAVERGRRRDRRAARQAGVAEVAYVIDDATAPRMEAGRLKWLADQLGLTQKEIARRIGVSPVVVNRVFKDPDRSTVATLRRIAAAMGLRLSTLISD